MFCRPDGWRNRSTPRLSVAPDLAFLPCRSEAAQGAFARAQSAVPNKLLACSARAKRAWPRNG
ncbi:hypothetical protein BN3658_00118 [Coriobacteriaceae bacterium CHKCI002]|nr:hypothetical protein BN3658_00118 [Coriobacteriaceae bacterium CHKCI002]